MSNIYMEYLTESEREDLILEKEIDLINTDIDYLFTTYEAVEDNKKKAILTRLIEKIRQLIKRLRKNLIPNLLNKIKKKKEIKVTNNDSTDSDKIKALPAPDPKNYNEKIYIKNGMEQTIKETDKLLNKLWTYEGKILKIIFNNKYDEKISDDDINRIRIEYNHISMSITPANQSEVLCQNKNIISNLNESIENIERISKQAEAVIDKVQNNIFKQTASPFDDDYIDYNNILRMLKSIIKMCVDMTRDYNMVLNNIRIEYVAK